MPSMCSSQAALLLCRAADLCGACQMEGMVTDLSLAREKQQDFDRWKADNEKQLPIDVQVTVLTTGFWPTYKVAQQSTSPTLLAVCVNLQPGCASRR